MNEFGAHSIEAERRLNSNGSVFISINFSPIDNTHFSESCVNELNVEKFGVSRDQLKIVKVTDFSRTKRLFGNSYTCSNRIAY